jgi:hypothetical protein
MRAGERIAKFNLYTDQIRRNPESLSLTAAEQAADPVTVVLARAAGITLPGDPGLPQEMQDIAAQAPGLYAKRALKGVTIRTDANPVSAEDLTVGLLPSGQYLHVTGTSLSEKEAIAKFFELYRSAPGHKALAVAEALLPGLHFEDDPSLTALIDAADMVRKQYAGEELGKRMSNPDDIGGALRFFNSQFASFFNDSAREDFWNSYGERYLGQQFFSGKFQYHLSDPEQTTPENKSYFVGTRADRIGRFIEATLRIAPNPRIAGAMLDAVKGAFDGKWALPNPGSLGYLHYAKDFYRGLSVAVELNPKRAAEVAGWLTDMLHNYWTVHGFPGMETIYPAASAGHVTLSAALAQAIKTNPDFKDLKADIDYGLELANTELEDDYEQMISNQEYTEFMKAQASALTPFFKYFRNDPDIGHGIVYQDTAAWDNIIGKALRLPPNAPDGRGYLPGTPQGNVIKLVKAWLRDQGAEGKTVTALPYKYDSPHAGLRDAGLFLIDTTARGDPNNQRVIDGEAAIEAVYMKGGGEADAKATVYQNFADYQKGNNNVRGAHLYLPDSPRLNGYWYDGRSFLPGGYRQFPAREGGESSVHQPDTGRVLTRVRLARMFTAQQDAASIRN